MTEMHSKKCLRFISSLVSVLESLGDGEEWFSLALKYVILFECANLSVSGTTAGICTRTGFFPWLPLEFINGN